MGRKLISKAIKTAANIVTGGPVTSAAKAAVTGGNVFQAASKGMLGQEGMFGPPSSSSFNPFSSQNLNSAGSGAQGPQAPQMMDPGAPPEMLDPRSAEYAFDMYQQKYAGRMPASALAGMSMAQKMGADVADQGIMSAGGSTASAMYNLARKGGLSQGAQERLARQGAYDALLARQKGAEVGAQGAMQAGFQGLRQAEQDARANVDAYMRLLQQNQQMAGNIYAANKGASIIANQPEAPGLFGGGGFLGTGIKLFG